MKNRILVIGANGGLGAALARMLHARGHDVAATVSRPEKVAAFKAECPWCDPVIALDLSDPAAVKERLADLVAGLPGLDGVIVCAAKVDMTPLELMPLDKVHDAFAVNSVSAVAIYQAVIDALRASKGRLIFTSSVGAIVPMPLQGAYCASKAALEILVDAMRMECSPWGVEVVALEPGTIATPAVPRLANALERDIAALSGQDSARYGELYGQMQALVRSALADTGVMKPETVAEAAIEALQAEEPKTRYPIGAEAEFLLKARDEKSDREMDEMILGMFASMSS